MVVYFATVLQIVIPHEMLVSVCCFCALNLPMNFSSTWWIMLPILGYIGSYTPRQKNQWNAHRVTVPGLGSSWPMRQPNQAIVVPKSVVIQLLKGVEQTISRPSLNLNSNTFTWEPCGKLLLTVTSFTADTKHQHFHTMAHAQWQVLRPLHDLNLGLVLPLYRVIFFAAGGSGFCNRWGCWGPFECTHVMCSITCWWSWTWLFGQRKKGAQHVAPSLPGPFSPSPLI